MRKFLSLLVVLGLLFSLTITAVSAQDPAPTTEATPEATEEATATPEPTEEATATTEPTGEATATTEPTGEATPTTEPTGEATATTEPTGEATATTEPTGEATATAEPTEEATAEPTQEATAEPTVEPTVEITPTTTITTTPEVTSTLQAESSEISSLAAKTAAYTSRLYVQNPTNSSVSWSIVFYPEGGGASTTFSPAALAGFGSSVVDVTSVSMNNGRYSAVVQSNQQLAVAYLQLTSGNAGDFAVDSGITEADTTYYIPSVQNSLGSKRLTSIIGIQNASGGPVNVTVNFLNPSGSSAGSITRNNIASNYATYIDVSSAALNGGGTLPDNFSGGAIVNASGDVVVSSLILSENGEASQGSNGIASGAPIVYLPTAQRNFGSQRLSSFTALQNPSTTSSIYYEVRYFNANGVQSGSTLSGTLNAGQKGNAHAADAGVPNGFLGSGIVRAYTNSSRTTPADIISVVNIGSSTVPHGSNSFAGATSGSTTVAVPFVSWGNNSSEIKTTIAIQNVGNGSASGTIRYYNANGVASTSAISFSDLAVGAKTNTKPQDWNGTNDYIGTILVTANQPVTVLVNVTRVDNRYKASYLGTPVTP